MSGTVVDRKLAESEHHVHGSRMPPFCVCDCRHPAFKGSFRLATIDVPFLMKKMWNRPPDRQGTRGTNTYQNLRGTTALGDDKSYHGVILSRRALADLLDGSRQVPGVLIIPTIDKFLDWVVEEGLVAHQIDNHFPIALMRKWMQASMSQTMKQHGVTTYLVLDLVRASVMFSYVNANIYNTSTDNAPRSGRKLAPNAVKPTLDKGRMKQQFADSSVDLTALVAKMFAGPMFSVSFEQACEEAATAAAKMTATMFNSKKVKDAARARFTETWNRLPASSLGSMGHYLQIMSKYSKTGDEVTLA